MDMWLSNTLEAKGVHTTELAQALGRLVVVYGVLHQDWPFPAPLYAARSFHLSGVVRTLLLYVLLVLRWLRDWLPKRRQLPLQRRATIRNAVLRVVAKAEGAAVAVGG